jgi:hypothetical protein
VNKKLKKREHFSLKDVLATFVLYLETENEPLMIDLSDDTRPFRIVSDIHGSLNSLLAVLDISGAPSVHNPIIVAGDMIDRGSNSMDIVIFCLLMKMIESKSMYVLKGNHEVSEHLHDYDRGVYCEIKTLFPDHHGLIYSLFKAAAKKLSLCARLRKVFICHAAPPRKQLSKLTHDDTHYMLWTDVHTGKEEKPGSRGLSVGHEIIMAWLESNGFECFVRGHQYQSDGYLVLGECTKVITIASSAFVDPINYMSAYVLVTEKHLTVYQYKVGEQTREKEVFEEEPTEPIDNVSKLVKLRVHCFQSE